jgi:siroheme synthase-like protein
VSGLPILIEGTALRVLVVGGGTVASRKAAVLIEAGARVRVIAPAVSDAMRAIADAGHVDLSLRRYERGDIGDAQLVIAATDDRAVNAAVSEEAHAARRLVNVADAPAEGSFVTMATHRSGALVIGVSAAGVPGAAARIRDAIGARFDSRYARALAELTTLRRELLDRGEGARWRARSAELLEGGFCDVVERGVLDEQVATWR